jgi:hypothetical protein
MNGVKLKQRRNPWSERFWAEILKNSVKTEDKKAINEWELWHIIEGIKEKCICSRSILTAYVFKNKLDTSKKAIVVGSCCLRRFGIRLKWKSKRDYLFNAMYYANNDWERDFVKKLLDKEVKWGGRLKISEKQKKVLEKITKRPWNWDCWKKEDEEQELTP